MEITREIAIKVRDTVDAGLVKGVGVQIPGRMCVEAAVCYAMGLPHSDKPPCVSPAIRRLKIQLNDSAWSSDKVRGAGMRRLAIAQLGSAGVVDEMDFVRRVVEMTIRRFIPIALRAAALIHPVAEHKIALEKAASRCEQAVTLNDCEAARAAAWAASEAAAAAAAAEAAARASEAAWAASWAEAAAAAAEAAARASEAAWAASWVGVAAAWAASWAASCPASWAAQDKLLSDFAEGVVQVLIEMKAPGCQWLDLVPIDAR